MEPSANPPKYTTMGSIINPNPTPLQPPARRGRAVKWPLQPDFGLVTSPISGLSFGDDLRSTPSADSQPLHYSPLQQNTDRAVSPIADNAGFTMPSISLAKMPSANAATGSGKRGDSNISSQNIELGDDQDDHDTLKHLKQMSTKTLTNLASYENPKQKMAQNILSAARSAPLLSARTQSDQTSIASMLQADGAGDQDTKMMSYSSILSKGPGAPRPLTAGPPGLRHHKPSTLNHRAASRQSIPMAADLSLSQQESRGSAYVEHDQSDSRNANSHKVYSVTSVREAFRKNHSSIKVIDTLSPDDARKYYNKGLLPANFNHHKQPLSSIAKFGLPTGQQTCFTRSPQGVLAHNLEVDALWSEGTAMFSKSMDHAIMEQKHRDFEEAIGRDADERQVKQKVTNRKLSVNEANRMPTGEHAEQLLSMAFQTLISLETFTLSGNLPKLEYREL